MSKITMTAIAAAAGVGIATVDRVLNRHAPVRAVTEQKVLEAASRFGSRIGHPQLINSVPQTANVTLHMCFILLSKSYSFYHLLTDALCQHTLPLHPAGSEPLFHWHDIDMWRRRWLPCMRWRSRWMLSVWSRWIIR